MFLPFSCILVPRTYQKTYQNDVRTLQKSMLKIYCFFTLIFLGFGLNFGSSWASNLEPSWQFCRQTVVIWAFLNQRLYENGILEGSGLNFRASRPRFRRVWDSPEEVLESSGPIFWLVFGRTVGPTFGDTCWQLWEGNPALTPLTSRRNLWPPRVQPPSGRGGVREA